jgi:ribonuclease Z
MRPVAKASGVGRLAVLGAGKLGGILVRAFLREGLVGRRDVVASVGHGERVPALKKSLGIHVTTDNRAAVRGADTILICLKPQWIRVVLEEVRDAIGKNALVISTGGPRAAPGPPPARPIGRASLMSPLLPSLLLAVLGTSPETLRITLLGTGNPRPSTERSGPASLVEGGGRRLLIDAGRGAVVRLSEIGLLPRDVDALFLTHLHSDHVVGLPDLWLTGWLFGRERPLEIVGPPGTEALARGLEAAFAFDVHVRRDLDEHLPGEGVRLRVREVPEGEAYRTPEGLVVTAFPVEHGPVRPALGFRVDFGGRSAVFSGDTAPSEELVRRARGADVLVHEVISEDLERSRGLTPSQIQKTLARHTTIPQAAALFARIRPRLAVYSHIVPSPAGEDDLIPATRAAGYAGPLAAGYDLMEITVGETVTVRDSRRPE